MAISSMSGAKFEQMFILGRIRTKNTAGGAAFLLGLGIYAGVTHLCMCKERIP